MSDIQMQDNQHDAICLLEFIQQAIVSGEADEVCFSTGNLYYYLQIVIDKLNQAESP